MVLEELCNLVNNALDMAISPHFAIDEGVAYTFADITNDGIKKQAQFSLTIIKKDLLEAYKIKNKLDEVLITFADERLTDNILKVVQSGGGTFFDADLELQKIKVTYTVTYEE